jgi:hypothetical protein
MFMERRKGQREREEKREGVENVTSPGLGVILDHIKSPISVC